MTIMKRRSLGDRQMFEIEYPKTFGWIIVAMLSAVLIGYFTMPTMSLGLRRDVFFFHRAFLVGLTVAILMATLNFCLMRFQVRILFFVELVIAFAIVASYYSSYKKAENEMQQFQNELEEASLVVFQPKFETVLSTIVVADCD